MIVSGGEASIHPNFIDFIAYGQELGYDWIQTISNGRSFASQKFAKAAADAGLKEVTFSMHGHNEALHDKLSGVKGAFKQALKGMLNLLRDGRLVVNVDVVINKMNVEHLEDILRFYQNLGIHEFDLLQLVPFGRAWSEEYRDELFYDVKKAFPHLQRAFRYAYRPGNYIWTNRFPVSMLEGMEELIQDPHKLHDELRGRMGEFQKFIDTGEKLACFGERCKYCFPKGMCYAIYDAQERVNEKRLESLGLAINDDGELPKSFEFLLSTQPIKNLRIKAPNFKTLLKAFASPKIDHEIGLSIELDDWSDYPERDNQQHSWLKQVYELVLSTAEAVEKLAGRSEALKIPINRQTARAAWQSRTKIATRADVTLLVPGFVQLSKAREQLVDMERYLKGWLKSSVKVENAPLCMHPNSLPSQAMPLDAVHYDEKGKLLADVFVDHYISHGYFAKSERCSDCIYNDKCNGMQINYLRTFGFKTLKPINN